MIYIFCTIWNYFFCNIGTSTFWTRS